MSEAQHIEDLKRVSKQLADSVSFDVNGALVGPQWRGGHGGMVSDKTLKLSDEVRRILSRLNAHD